MRDKGALEIGRDRIAARAAVRDGFEIEQRIIVRNVDIGKLPRNVRGRLPRDGALVALGVGRGRRAAASG